MLPVTAAKSLSDSFLPDLFISSKVVLVDHLVQRKDFKVNTDTFLPINHDPRDQRSFVKRISTSSSQMHSLEYKYRE